MAFYALVKRHENSLHVIAANRAEALAKFSEALGKPLTTEPTGTMEDYLLDEWTGDGVHVIFPTRHVWIKH